MHRREFLWMSTASALSAQTPDWKAGNVVHLLPACSARRLLLKVSLREPAEQAPRLALGRNRPVQARRSDSKGFYWSFDIDGLDPSRTYTLHLTSSRGAPLCDPWPVRMMPSAEERPKQLRVAIYTCAGGHEGLTDENGRGAFLPLAIRQRLFRRMLSFEPQAAIAIGDHVYWDQRSAIGRRGARDAQQVKLASDFRRDQPILGTPNEDVLKRATAPQIADLYGTLFRSTPMYFVQDDHDYFDNDEASDALVTLPPDAFMLRAARATRRLFYPEFLPEAGRPDGLAGSFEFEPNISYSECFGTFRYGLLAEMLIYDCRRHLTLSGPSAGFVPDTAEQWLAGRTAANDTRHLVHVPGVPFGWSAGKWGEWYADVLDDQGKLTVKRVKPYWQAGWRAQHDRILRMLASNRQRVPLVISGDLHSHALGRIRKSGDVDLREHPVNVSIAGPISTGPSGWPSAARNTLAQTAIGLDLETRIPVVEHNGFTIADFTESEVTLRFFGWKLGTASDRIDTLEPFHTERFAA
ncbi:MAG: alkaline phosphatase D family protein [Bryobacterales bacterium]|nr:alkaline phosphatase D family protein [Bryobacterales bacterium]